MGGNSNVSTTTRPRAPAKADPNKAKIDKLISAVKKLSAADRKEAVAALKDAGLGDLAKALQGVTGQGSKPAERPSTKNK